MQDDKPHFQQSDRDLLVELRTQMRGLILDIKEMKDGTRSDIKDMKNEIEDLKLFKSNITGRYVVWAILGGVFISTIASIITFVITHR